MRTTIDSGGRVVIPKAFRERLNLAAGAEVEIEFRNGRIEIGPPLIDIRTERRGNYEVLVAPAGTPAPDQWLDQVREDRLKNGSK